METQLTEQENTRALEMLNYIEANPDITQMTLADELGVAVGTINWYLKRLVSKGYVKVKRAQRKKLRYIITPEGLALRARLTVDYIQNSFHLYRLVRGRVLTVIAEARERGYTAVRLEGTGDVAEVCRLTCLEQGLSIVEDSHAPRLIVRDLKVFLETEEQPE
jgi:DNA-binding MarR family transcriptional regulator